MTREEAIKVVKEFISTTCLHMVDQEALETLIPELRDEDEELEKEIATWIPQQIKGAEEGKWKELRDATTKWGGIVARHFAQWQKERMMQKAVETTVVESYGCEKGEDGKWKQVVVPTIHTIVDNCSFGDKVRIIIVKEDKK